MIHDLFRRLKPLYPAQIARLWIEYQTADPARQREIEELLTILAIKRQGMMIGDERLVLDAPPPGLIGQGEFTIGNVEYPGLPPYPFRIARNELLRHVFVLGPTGTGKSTLLLNLLLQLCTARVPFMAFDFKRNYRCLLAATQHVIVCTVGRETAPLQINALVPPRGVQLDEWASALADIISTSYLLLQGARNVLKTALLQAARAQGGTLGHAHTLLRVALDASKAGSRRYGWLESSNRALEELTTGQFGRSLNATSGTPVEDVLDRAIVVELHGLGDDQKRFFCLLMLQAILLLRKNGTARRERLQHLLIFDEAHNVFPRERLGEVSVPARLAREVREYGEAIIAATQQADVSESLIANSGFKLILRCDYPKDVLFASQLLQIDARWLPKLPLGTGIARLPVRCYAPVLFTFNEQPVKNLTITDAVVRKQWAQRGLTARSTPVLRTQETALLHDIAQYPVSTITQRYERLGWNARAGNSVKDGLIAAGLVTIEAVPTPTAQVKILSLTVHGCAVLADAGISVARPRHGGAAHEYWKTRVREHLEHRGFTVHEEYAVGGGKTVDVYAERDGRHVAVEVETGRSDIMANVTKCAELPGEVVFVFTDASTRALHEAAITHRLPRARVLTTTELNLL